MTITTTTYSISGMTCDHCVAAVKTELVRLPGVSHVGVDLAPGSISTVTVTSHTPLANGDVTAAIEEAGYRMSTTP